MARTALVERLLTVPAAPVICVVAPPGYGPHLARRLAAGHRGAPVRVRRPSHGPGCLVLDHVELLENPACLDVVAELALGLPAGSRLALAARRAPELPVALLRAQAVQRVQAIGLLTT